MSSKETKYEDKTVLSYYEVLLRSSDVDLLRGPHWLNDAIIGFYFEYLEHTHEDSETGKREVLFVSPSMAQLLKLTDPRMHPSLLEPLDATEFSYILFPLNNCESRDSVGGSHWSLLVFSKRENTCFHLDSCRGTNQRMAFRCAKNIMDYLSDSKDTTNVEESSCPQQDNGYDCGLYTICLADIILKRIAKVPEIKECTFDGVGNSVRTKREELLRLIDELKDMPQI